MVLNSLPFAAFFLIFLAVLLVLPKKLRNGWLFFGNCLFYLSWDRWGFVLLLLSVLMIWLCGMGISAGRSPAAGDGKRSVGERLLLIVPIAWSVGLLVVFKYAGLIDGLIGRFHVSFPMSMRSLLPPIGLSFYTLRCISYIAEVWKGSIAAVRNPFDLITYVSFFPQIISGPIEHPGKFLRKLEEFSEKDLRNFERIRNGFLLFVWGLFLKIVLAERLSIVSSHIFDSFQQYGFWELLIASFAYTLQIYCDFNGYSEMSRGIAAMMGFSAARNFRQPYLAAEIKNFWRRWHISLTSWLTDYIYIPLGGSRRGLMRKYINILIVFAVSGLWHGSTLNFLFWGLLHAVFQITEDLRNRAGIRIPKLLLHILTVLEVNFAWIFFNSGGLNRGFRIIRQMFSRFTCPKSFDFGLIPGNLVVLGIGLVILVWVDVLHEKGVSIYQKTKALPLPVRWLLYLGLFWVVIMLGLYGVGYDTTGFIYAQF